MTGKNVNLKVGNTSIRCSHCGCVLAEFSASDDNVVVDFLGHIRSKHPECLIDLSGGAIHEAIRQQSAVHDAIIKQESNKGKRLIHPYLPPQ